MEDWGFNTPLDFKQIAIDTLMKACTQIIQSYGKLYEEDENRDRLFMKELVNTIIQVDTLTYVYLRDGTIHPSYCLEKLEIMKYQVEAQIRYWNERRKEVTHE